MRLSPIGRLALPASTARPADPLALIEGTLYRGGRIPPFSPRLIVDTLTRLQHERDVPFTDADIDLSVGTPSLPTNGGRREPGRTAGR